ncbi:hypothetical protein J2Z18_004412 [Paenibacillus lactis]|uniref:Uncharacterized protein n=2 Tax=Paenibacillus lactis TaxID=228574 RepID=G4HG42_9BACL|nr:hypothetical protein PaelaDRAFT_3167 [Paenibacillus lactis 154]MBP1895302.1 hypothetical protein [Paenibacillus lactis]
MEFLLTAKPGSSERTEKPGGCHYIIIAYKQGFLDRIMTLTL